MCDDMFKTYLTFIPQNGPFYKRPLLKHKKDAPRFSSQNIGHNTLKVYLKRMYEVAGIDMTDKNISNHSGKVTLCTELFNHGFDDQLIRTRSGHRSNCVDRYKRPAQNLLK